MCHLVDNLTTKSLFSRAMIYENSLLNCNNRYSLSPPHSIISYMYSEIICTVMIHYTNHVINPNPPSHKRKEIEECKENSEPIHPIFDRISDHLFSTVTSSLDIKSPFLKCTIQEIIISSMNWELVFLYPLFYPWVRQQIH